MLLMKDRKDELRDYPLYVKVGKYSILVMRLTSCCCLAAWCLIDYMYVHFPLLFYFLLVKNEFVILFSF